MDAINWLFLGIMLAALALAILLPATVRCLDPLARAFRRLARRQRLAVLVVTLTAFVGRGLLVVLFPTPIPSVHDEFSHLLAADTFAAGRLANPPHALWPHFESMHILQQPTYATMYPPGQGLALAAGQALTEVPWVGVWISTSLLCGVLCWMLQGWLPPKWALLGGLLAVLRFALVGYWINSYWGGSVPALGGALVAGAWPRVVRAPRPADAVLMALGAIILANSRPYEGLLLCAMAALGLVWRLVRLDGPELRNACLRFVLPAALTAAVGAFATGYYFYRVTGSPWKMPYQLNRETYAVAGHFLWQQPRAVPDYRHVPMRDFYVDWELAAFRHVTGKLSLVSLLARVKDVTVVLTFGLLGPLIAAPLVMLPWIIRDRRVRPLLLLAVAGIVGVSVEVFLAPHYLAPFVGASLAVAMQGLRHVRTLSWRNHPIGTAIVRLLPISYLAILAIGIGVLRSPAADLPPWPVDRPLPRGVFVPPRAPLVDHLLKQPGNHLVIVRHLPGHDVHDEWVYNPAGIDRARIVFAREMTPAENQRLVDYFADRKIWLVELLPDRQLLSPYPLKPQAK